MEPFISIDPILLILVTPVLAWIIVGLYAYLDQKPKYAKSLPSMASILQKIVKKKTQEGNEIADNEFAFGDIRDGLNREICRAFEGRAVQISRGDKKTHLSNELTEAEYSEMTQKAILAVHSIISEFEKKASQYNEDGSRAKQYLDVDEKDLKLTINSKKLLRLVRDACVNEAKSICEAVKTHPRSSWSAFFQDAQAGRGYLCPRRPFILARLLTGRDLEAIVNGVVRNAGGDEEGMPAGCVSVESLAKAFRESSDVGKEN
mmetsp:Transcript_1578/g.3609  ORF Transcript_1578/g.3609 Transcript_1578/m.3609 type:complete len:261 (-) Transcript_1578:121-903(-)